MRSLGKDLVYSIPAVLLMVVVGIVLFQEATVENAQLAGRYQLQARRAINDKNFEWALRCYRKAEQFGEPSPELIYEKGICLQSMGDQFEEQAAAVMRQVVEKDAEFDPARLWLVNHLLSKKDVTPEELKHAEEELDEVLERKPNSVMAHRLAVPIKSRNHGLAAALPHLERLAPMSETDRLRLAAAYSATDDQSNAAKQAQRVRDEVIHKLGNNSANTPLRLLGVQACVIMRDFKTALALLNDGLRKQGRDERLMRALSSTYLAWSEYARQQDAPRDKVLELLLLSAKVPPSDPRAYQRLAAFVVGDEEHRNEVKNSLISVLARTESSALLQIMLGEFYYREGNHDQAKRYWDVALDLDSNAVVAMNNLAWGLAWQDPPDLDGALRLIERAIKKDPQRAQLRDTRGQILFKRGEYDRALADLKFAAKQIPEDWRIQAVLSEIYTQQGRKDLAASHREQSEKLRAKARDEGKTGTENPTNPEDKTGTEDPTQPEDPGQP